MTDLYCDMTDCLFCKEVGNTHKCSRGTVFISNDSNGMLCYSRVNKSVK